MNQDYFLINLRFISLFILVNKVYKIMTNSLNNFRKINKLYINQNYKKSFMALKPNLQKNISF